MQLIGRFLRGLLLFILLIVCAVLFYVLVIMGDTGPDEVVEMGSAAAVGVRAREVSQGERAKGVWEGTPRGLRPPGPPARGMIPLDPHFALRGMGGWVCIRTSNIPPTCGGLGEQSRFPPVAESKTA